MTVGEIKEMIKGWDDNEQLILLLEKPNGEEEWHRIKRMTVDKYVSIKDCIKVLKKFCDTQDYECYCCPLFIKHCCHIPIVSDNLSDDVLNFNYNVQEKYI